MSEKKTRTCRNCYWYRQDGPSCPARGNCYRYFPQEKHIVHESDSCRHYAVIFCDEKEAILREKGA